MSVTITQIDTFHVLYPVAGHFKFFENVAGRPFGRPAVLVRIVVDDGLVSELISAVMEFVAPDPCHSPPAPA